MNDFTLNKLIGSASINLATLYKSMSHEIYQQWLVLSNPYDYTNEETETGLLMVSCYIIGANDNPPVHNMTGAGTYGKDLFIE